MHNHGWSQTYDVDGSMTEGRAAVPVSVVIATMNACRTVEATLLSIRDQIYCDLEVVVLDGGSSDDTTLILQRYAGDLAYWESEPDRGVYHAWNKALDHVTGEWICFLGADDRFASPSVVSAVAPYLEAAPAECRVVYASINLLNPEGKVVAEVGEPWESAKLGLRQRMTLPNPATFYHRSLFDLHGRFDERFRITGDYEFLLRELIEHDAVFVPGLVAVLMDDGGLSTDPRHRALRIREMATARHMHGLTRVPPWASPPVVKASVRAGLERMAGKGAADRVRGWYRTLTRQPRD